MTRLSNREARQVLLTAQGLSPRLRRKATKQDVLEAIRRMGALQIDTINVVARSPFLVLWSRLGQYDPRWLNELLAEGALFEYWAHAACFLPIEDYQLYEPRMHNDRPRHKAWLERNADLARRVLETVREKGEVRSVDFKRTGGRGEGWWDWKPEKLALECLLMTGELMIARRDNGFQRVYAPRERVLKHAHALAALTPDEARQALILKTVRALGVAQDRWIPDYFYLSVRPAIKLIEGLATEGQLVRMEVEGWDRPGYVHPENLELVDRAADGDLTARGTTFLSPFDPVVANRERAKELFGFHYRIEVYTPSERRQFGYFTLPILYRDALVGRLDAKAHRKDGVFEIRAIHLEPATRLTGDLVTSVARALQDCATWHGTPEIRVLRSEPAELALQLGRLV